MRMLFYRLASKLRAPLWLRSRLLPSGKAVVTVRQIDPVQEFCRELGIKPARQKNNLIRRIFSVAHSWAKTDTATAAVAAAAATAAVSVVVVVTTVATIVVALVAVVAVLATVVIAAEEIKRKKIANVVFFYTFFIELFLVALSSLVLPMMTWIFPVAPLAFIIGIYLFHGIRGVARGEGQQIEQRTPEQLVAEAFERFVAEQLPDVVGEKSALNVELQDLSTRITEAKDVLARMQGELRADKGEWADTIAGYIVEMESGIAKMEERKNLIQEVKTELLAAIQVLEPIKSRATTVVRLDGLRHEGRKLLGRADFLASSAESRLTIIYQDLRLALERINQAVEKLGLATLPGLEDGGSVKAFLSGAKTVGEASSKTERHLRAME